MRSQLFIQKISKDRPTLAYMEYFETKYEIWVSALKIPYYSLSRCIRALTVGSVKSFSKRILPKVLDSKALRYYQLCIMRSRFLNTPDL